jgi:hypothetical protein
MFLRGALAVTAALSSGCIAEYSGNTMSAAKPYVLTRATKDLSCPTKKISVYRELGGRWIANGCGRSATYQSVCQQLQCQVTRPGEEPAAWRDRPDMGTLDPQR